MTCTNASRKSIDYCMTYTMYCECAEGGLNRRWKLEDRMTAGEFRERLGKQMCQYESLHLKYPGGAEVRSTTQQSKKQRGTEKDRFERDESNTFRVLYGIYLDAKFPRGKDAAMCSDNFKLLKEHLNSYSNSSTKGKCQMCGHITHAKCLKYKRHCCLRKDKKKWHL